MTDRQTDRQVGRQTDRQADRQAGRQAGRQVGRQAGGQAGGLVGRQVVIIRQRSVAVYPLSSLVFVSAISFSVRRGQCCFHAILSRNPTIFN